MLGIIGAMDKEVATIKMQLTDAQVEIRAAMDFYKGELEGKEIAVAHSGIGEVNTAICTQTPANIYGITGVINTGVAGSLKTGTDIGGTVLSSDTVQHDMDATGFDYEPRQIPRVETPAFKADESLIHLAEKCCSKVNPDTHAFVGRVVTGDQFISDKGKEKWLTDTFGGYCTGIGGATTAQACYLNSIPFLTAGAIFDETDDSATIDYPAFEAKAIIHSVSLLTEIVRSI